MKTISIINLKGGVGKTFTAIQMAYGLQLEGKKVLLLDNDKQGNLSKFYKVYSNTEECAAAKLLSTYQPILKTLEEETQYKNQYIINANMSLLTATLEVTKTTASDQHLRFKRIIQQAEKAGYDYMIIDNPPDMGLNVINALIITDDVIVPIKIDEWALEGLDIIIEQIENAKALNEKIRFAGALVTNYKKNDSNIAGVDWLKESNYKIFDTKIRYSDKATESIFFHKAVQEYSPRSAVAIDYKKFIKEYESEVTYGKN
ncbi:chromosome partitioning protein [Ruminiclostridium sufflavum DSM 19573]|uniref:Chromosome partitioning protein n=1 Tax=Ruminiclostridium sufflavum DSM 19573 TaxID=1121337 RepID=A0A318XNJ1_9FIRM|nr:ParA family protein [Ruminiclostridium sufflavum]PYG88481.1 chromosome partitioning protein [Ruminiclostridium sufflavum DSM 19573]